MPPPSFSTPSHAYSTRPPTQPPTHCGPPSVPATSPSSAGRPPRDNFGPLAAQFRSTPRNLGYRRRRNACCVRGQVWKNVHASVDGPLPDAGLRTAARCNLTVETQRKNRVIDRLRKQLAAKDDEPQKRSKLRTETITAIRSLSSTRRAGRQQAEPRPVLLLVAFSEDPPPSASAADVKKELSDAIAGKPGWRQRDEPTTPPPATTVTATT